MFGLKYTLSSHSRNYMLVRSLRPLCSMYFIPQEFKGSNSERDQQLSYN